MEPTRKKGMSLLLIVLILIIGFSISCGEDEEKSNDLYADCLANGGMLCSENELTHCATSDSSNSGWNKCITERCNDLSCEDLYDCFNLCINDIY